MSLLKNGWVLFLFLISLFRIQRKKWKYESKESTFTVRKVKVFLGKTEQELTHNLKFWTNEIDQLKSNPICLNFLYSETYPFAKSIKYIKVCAIKSSKDLLPLIEKDCYLEFIHEEQLKRYQIHSDISFNLPILKEFSSVTYYFQFLIETKKYPDEIIVNVEMVWENEKKEFEIQLQKTVYKSSKINPKY